MNDSLQDVIRKANHNFRRMSSLQPASARSGSIDDEVVTDIYATIAAETNARQRGDEDIRSSLVPISHAEIDVITGQ